MSLNKDLTIIFVSFYSKKLIEKPLNKISKDLQIFQNNVGAKNISHVEFL